MHLMCVCMTDGVFSPSKEYVNSCIEEHQTMVKMAALYVCFDTCVYMCVSLIVCQFMP